MRHIEAMYNACILIRYLCMSRTNNCGGQNLTLKSCTDVSVTCVHTYVAAGAFLMVFGTAATAHGFAEFLQFLGSSLVLLLCRLI